jgi:hypothetical protein
VGYEAVILPPSEIHPRFLNEPGMAHLLAFLLAVAGLIALPFVWPGACLRGELADLRVAVHATEFNTALYLLATAFFELRLAMRREPISRRSDRTSVLVGHAVVLVGSTWVMARGFESLALLTGFDPTLAILITVSAINLLVCLFVWNTGRRELEVADESRLEGPNLSDAGLAALITLCGVLVVASFMYLENHALPNTNVESALKAKAISRPTAGQEIR